MTKLASNIIQELLSRTRHRLDCFATAFIAPSKQLEQFNYASDKDHSYAIATIQRCAESLFAMCREQREPVVRNRVREADGPTLCRFLVAPVYQKSTELVGILVLYNDATGAEFTVRNARIASRFARIFSHVISLPRDPLTGLLNRDGFERHIGLHAGSHLNESSAALLYGDIDQLSVINDLWGFEAGDRAIALVAQQIQTVLPSKDVVVSRLSADRFTAFLPQCTLDHARQLAEKMRVAVAAARFVSNAHPIQLSTSWGVAKLDMADLNVDHALAAAEVACKAAKQHGRNCVEVYQDVEASVIRRRDDMIIIDSLRSALDEGRLQMLGQPIASLLQTECARRYEILVRMLDDNDKLVLPAQFMPSATRYQVLPQVDRHVISHVLTKLRIAKVQPGFKPVQVSFNLSGATISEPEFIKWLLDQLDHCEIPNDWINFEITENAAMANLERAQLLIETLGAKGCKFALDNFGTGLNSLASLKSLNITTLKLDGSYVRDVLENKRSEALVRAIAQLAKSLEIEIVAECVESPAICMRLIELGVQFGQGYALGHPVALERILDPTSSFALPG